MYQKKSVYLGIKNEGNIQKGKLPINKMRNLTPLLKIYSKEW